MESRLMRGRTAAGRPLFLHMVGGPFIDCGDRRVEPPEGSKRLLAFLAFHDTKVERLRVAGELWPGVDRHRANGNLRTALWRLHGAGLDLIDSDNHALTLRTDVAVDVRIVDTWANRIINGHNGRDDLPPAGWMEDCLCVLPGWYEDWVVVERERLRQRVLHALELLSRRLCQAGRFAEGVEAALVAVAAEPLRECAQQALIEAHLAEGNLVEAHRARDSYRRLLHRELGAQLSPLMSSLISGCGRTPSVEPALVR